MHKPLTSLQKLMLKAAEVLEQYGHKKHRIGSVADGGFCLRGALHYAAGNSWARQGDDALTEIAVNITNDPAADWLAAINWNNAPERTAAEVIAKLREVALS